MTRCAQRTGFLTLLTCGEPAVAVCVRCGKTICACHLQSTPSGPFCPDCAVIGLGAEDASRRGLNSSYYRQSVGSDSEAMIYSSSDYGSFDTFQGGGGEMDGGGASDDWGDSDNAGGSDGGSADDFQDS